MAIIDSLTEKITLVGRDDLINSIKNAIFDMDQSCIFYIDGVGGVGKTRILEEIEVIVNPYFGNRYIHTGIIDLYHSKYHSPGGMRQAIIEGIDPTNEYFDSYWNARTIFDERRDEGMAGKELEELRLRLDIVFVECYQALALNKRIVICLDTMELIQYENDEVQQLCQIQNADTAIKDWIISVLPRLNNTVIIVAGRPQPVMKAEFKHVFENYSTSIRYNYQSIESLSEQETIEFLQKVRVKHPEIVERLEISNKSQKQIDIELYHASGGKPVLLALVLDTVRFGGSFQPNMEPDIDLIRNVPGMVGEIATMLISARKGLNSSIFCKYMGEDDETEVQKTFEEMYSWALIKRPAGTDRIFFHDEVYDIEDRSTANSAAPDSIYRWLADYYLQKTEAATSPRTVNERKEIEQLHIAQLYNAMQSNFESGYELYKRWDEDAIKAGEIGYDMQLRDEVLRFLNRYTEKKRLDSSPNPFYSPKRIAPFVRRDKVDRDCAVRWVKRYLARGDMDKAKEVAKNLRYSQLAKFRWDDLDDPIYKSSLLISWCEAMLYSGDTEESIQSKLDETIELLEKFSTIDENDAWWRAKILGRAYNNLGFMHRQSFRLSTALRYYQVAINQYRQTDIPMEMADTLNNASYAHALLGETARAKRLAEDALEIRQELDLPFQIALSENTRGLIYLLADQPHRARPMIENSLKLFDTIGTRRGRALSNDAMGRVLHQIGRLVHVYRSDERRELLEKARTHLNTARNFWGDKTSSELLGTLQVLASVERDLGLLENENQRELHLEQSASIFNTIIERVDAEGTLRWAMRKADALEDIADIELIRNHRGLASSILDQAELSIPLEYHIPPKEGFNVPEKPVEEFWEVLGKIHLQRARIHLEPIRNIRKRSSDTDLIPLLAAMTDYLLALAYFTRIVIETSERHQSTIDEIYSNLKAYGLPRLGEIRKHVESIANQYKISASLILDEIDITLGYLTPDPTG